MTQHHHHKHHHEHEVYGKLLEIIEDLVEDLILAEEILEHYICHHCQKETVHRLFRENPDGSFDEVGLKCHNCGKTL
jgi:hypothetical protein